MSDKELLKTIQNDIKILDKYIEKYIDDDECIDYLETIKKNMRIQELEILKRISINKLFKEQQTWIKLHHTIKAQSNQLT